MRVFVDTSAFLAILSSDDQNHNQAGQTWTDLVNQEARLTCSNYTPEEKIIGTFFDLIKVIDLVKFRKF